MVAKGSTMGPVEDTPPPFAKDERLLTPRFMVASALGTAAALLALGLPTAIIPSPFFTRMTPTEAFNVVVWLASAPLIGVLLATYIAPAWQRSPHARHLGAGAPTTFGGVAAFLAIGCPICNKLVVAALGVNGALSVFAPLQPLIGAASVGLLGATLWWRVRQLRRTCARCAST